jgi:hypothetical protein
VRHRVDQLEQNILLILSNSQQPPSPETPNATHLTPQFVTAPLESDVGSLHPTAQHDSGDFFDRGLISLEKAENLLSCYRSMSQHHFPYVLLPDGISLSQLRRERPFLLQAILTVSSWKNRHQQLVLEEQLLKDFGVRFFVECEKTLEILQALLVYLAWCVLPLGKCTSSDSH